MDKAEYTAALQAVIIAARMVGQYDIPELLNAIERADTIGPIVDPTLWRDKHKAMDEDRAAFEAALPLWRLARKLGGEHG